MQYYRKSSSIYNEDARCLSDILFQECPKFPRFIIPKIINLIPPTYPLCFSQLRQFFLLLIPEFLQRLPQSRPLKNQRNIVEGIISLRPQNVIDLFDIRFQFCDDQVTLSDYVRFDAQGAPYAEGTDVRFACRCAVDGGGALAVILEGRVGRAGLGGVKGFGTVTTRGER